MTFRFPTKTGEESESCFEAQRVREKWREPSTDIINWSMHCKDQRSSNLLPQVWDWEGKEASEVSTSTSRGGGSWNCSQLYGARVSTGGLPAAKEGRDLVGMTSPTIYVRTVLGIDRLWRRGRTSIFKSHDISNVKCYVSTNIFHQGFSNI